MPQLHQTHIPCSLLCPSVNPSWCAESCCVVVYSLAAMDDLSQEVEEEMLDNYPFGSLVKRDQRRALVVTEYGEISSIYTLVLGTRSDAVIRKFFNQLLRLLWNCPYRMGRKFARKVSCIEPSTHSNCLCILSSCPVSSLSGCGR
ncbi:hypothetical protein Pyn_20259 [Prunus yedoensis var. nudiflora]|uniref:Uncharacterized protein n=1 Tax=Prunus yedoensis var. nudiflora TaxID=2094558 RepID=A0A314YIG9_PRUYE|nr:hypothetical protein Pyn_20259 [Prunus yedoensis var. nudiflora]